MAVASYGSATKSSGVVRILKDLDAVIEGRDVLIVEDIVDSGLTLQYLLRNLAGRNPRSLEVCALLIKPERQKVDLDEIRGLRDSEPVRDRLRARLRRALQKLAVRGRVERVNEAMHADPMQPALAPQTQMLRLTDPGDCHTGVLAPAHAAITRYEQVFQERRVPDTDRGRARVLRAEADRQLEAGPQKQTFGDLIYQLDHGGVQSLSLHQKDNTANVTHDDGQKYTVGYPDGYVSQLINGRAEGPLASRTSTSRARPRTAGCRC